MDFKPLENIIKGLPFPEKYDKFKLICDSDNCN